MFFIFSIIELIFLVSGIGMLVHHNTLIGVVLIVIATGLFLITSLFYMNKNNRDFDCDCFDGYDCGFIEGFACAECLESTSVPDCTMPDCDLGDIDCGN